MKISKIFGPVLLALLVLGVFSIASAQEEGEPAPDEEQGWFCPWAGQYGMGPGMMWDRGYWGRGQGGMMGPGPGYGRYRYNRSAQDITMDQAEVLVEHWLATMGNPNLKRGKITDKDTYFEAEILTKDDSLVDTLMVNKATGWMKSVYQR